METPILLTTLNARYQHCAFGLRYLHANLGELKPLAKIAEYTISQNPGDIVESILKHAPRIVGFGVYIWNTRQTYDVISSLKRVRPELVVVLGGPEVSHESSSQPIVALADYVIQGEADFLFREFCGEVLVREKRPERKLIAGELPDVKRIILPYDEYSDEDIRNRVIYVEASRGCPYKCEYCLSSLDKSVRNFDLDSFLREIQSLIDRGARQFKFVDRTFNLSISTSTKILEFFLSHISLGLFLHFEMVPDRLPAELRDLIRRFPAGSLQFEVGIQTWSPEVARLVSRRQDYGKIRENIEFLKRDTGVHLHADLIAGLPGETLQSFAEGFDALASLEPHEIQLGILKRLKGTPIIRHDAEWGMLYQEDPPFQVLQTKTMDFAVLRRLSRFSKFWDLVANSGNFVETMRLLTEASRLRARPSLFWEFQELVLFLSERHPQSHGVALLSLLESVWLYLKDHPHLDSERVRKALIRDYAEKVKRDVPRFLREGESAAVPSRAEASATPRRQARHVQGEVG